MNLKRGPWKEPKYRKSTVIILWLFNIAVLAMVVAGAVIALSYLR